MANLDVQLAKALFTQITPVLKSGTITLAATPIGNTLDASLRLIVALQEAEVIAAEDTRKLKGLASRLGIRLTAETFAFHEHNEDEKTSYLLHLAKSGLKVLVVSDAGMPSVSDPGYKVVKAAKAEGLEIEIFPGPSALLTALVHSGLPVDRFSFEGFLPKSEAKLVKEFSRFKHEAKSAIFFESPRRLKHSLKVMGEVLEDSRQVAIARELTKIHQEVICDQVAKVAKWADENEVLGEIVIVLGPATKEIEITDLLPLVNSKVAGGQRLKDASKEIASQYQVSARQLYEACLKVAAKNRDSRLG